MSINITFNELTQAFGQGAVQRGRELFKAGKTINYQVNPESVIKGMHFQEIDAKVIGSGGAVYFTHVDIFQSKGSVNIESDCSCPVGENCKHGAAVVFQYIQDQQVQQSQAKTSNFDNWWHMLNVLLPLENASEEWFSFRLFGKQQHNYSPVNRTQNQLEIFRHTYTLRGNLAKPKLIKNTTFANKLNATRMPSRYLGMETLIGLCAEDRWNPVSIHFMGSAGFLLLKQLVQTGEAFFQAQTQPLEWQMTPLALRLNYQACSSNQGKLVVDLEPSQYLVLCHPPIVINTETQQVCEAVAPVSSSVLAQLLNMPEASPEQFDQLMSRLEVEQEQLPKAQRDLRLPDIPTIKTIEISQSPTPVLSMDEPLPYPYFRCLFQYGDFYIDPNPQQEVIRERHQGRKIILHRDLAAEQAALAQLSPYLVPADPNDFELKLQNVDAKVPSFLVLREGTTHTPEGLSNFLALQDALPKLAAEGWQLVGFEQSQMEVIAVEKIQVASQTHNDWFELSFDMTIAGQKVSMAPLLEQLIKYYGHSDAMPEKLSIATEDQAVLQFQKSQIAPLFDAVLQLYQGEAVGGNKVRVQPFNAHLVAGLDNSAIEWIGSKDSLNLAQKLMDFKGIETLPAPEGLNATLRPYQQFGLNWLNFLHQHHFNGILADDMGLGKTLQTLSWCLSMKENGQLNLPVLLVVPTSLIGNWKREAQLFTPSLNILTLHGAERFELFEQMAEADMVLTSYPLVQRDAETLAQKAFSYLILDEAQKIKNPKTKLYLALQQLKSQHRLCLTGTPMENHLGELWALFNFLMPGFLGNLKQFKANFQKPIEVDRVPGVQAMLNAKIAPFLLRRTKHQVVQELPDKTEIIKTVEFEKDQANLYETIRLTMEDKVREAVAQKGLAQSQITLLDALLKLRQVCCDPGLVKIEAAQKVKHSAKMALLLDLLSELLEGNHRVIIFSQFAEMLKRIATELTQAKIDFCLLTGQTKDREAVINRFKDGEVSVFLISLKAGGVGLNLTEADTVIHYDPWWNPAVENQATDRAYRIGQNKEVFVYKLVVANTIEQKILAMQAQKQALQDQLYQKGNTDEMGQINLKAEDLLQLLQK